MIIHLSLNNTDKNKKIKKIFYIDYQYSKYTTRTKLKILFNKNKCQII